MKKELIKVVEIPDEVEIKREDDILIVKGPLGENKKKIGIGKLIFEIGEKEIKIGHKKATKKEKKRINTIVAHIKNMIKGVKEKHEYKLKICSSHFPINVNVENGKVVIKNFLGEKNDREAEIPEGVEVEIKGQEIIVSSTNKELAGQAAANLERATKIRGKDRRIFQDGIYITHKGGKEI